MILTITLNPSIDISYQLNHFALDHTNRVEQVAKTAGGKGLNVTRVLHQLGDATLATGFVGGVLGDKINELLQQQQIKTAFTPVQQESRNCVSILSENKQTEILEAGPTISLSEQQAFIEQYKKLIQSADVIVMSGSLAKGISHDFYQRLIELAEGKKVILDCAGNTLKQSLMGKVKPYVIKPNLSELADLLGEKITEVKSALNDGLFNGVACIVVSQGAKGAFVKYHDDFYQVSIPKIDVISPVGSGDSVVAGIASGLQRGYDIEQLLKHAMVLGMLNARELKTGFVNLAHYDELFVQVKVEKLT